MGEYMKTMIELMQYVLTVSSYDHTALMVCHLTDRIPLRRGYIISFVVENSAKEVFFYEETTCFDF